LDKLPEVRGLLTFAVVEIEQPVMIPMQPGSQVLSNNLIAVTHDSTPVKGIILARWEPVA
jgi:hypothetical protein